MFQAHIFAALACAAVAFASPLAANATENTTIACGNNPSHEWIVAAEERFRANKVEASSGPDRAVPVIQVVWHVITDGSAGNVPNSQIAAQVQVFNSAFRSAGVQWQLVDITRTNNFAWFSRTTYPQISQEEYDMKTALRRGGLNVLNIYSVGYISGGKWYGFATFPDEYQSYDWRDGIVFDYRYLPGGSIPGFDLGISAVHELGHWVGLYHVFQGGCNYPGDFVDDTPFQAREAFQCVRRDTCPQPGYDNIHNFMDYTDDRCRTLFTSGQINRFRNQLATYRGIRF